MFRYIFIIMAIAYYGTAVADSWSFKPIKKDRVEVFGTTKIVLTTDSRKNKQYPDFVLSIYQKGNLLAKYKGISFDQIFSSPDHALFLGISNSGLPGTAVVLFDKEGNLRLEAKHDLAVFDYCEQSVTMVRKWYDEEKPNVRFVLDHTSKEVKAITLRSCKGNVVDLFQVVLQAYNRSLQRLTNQTAARAKGQP